MHSKANENQQKGFAQYPQQGATFKYYFGPPGLTSIDVRAVYPLAVLFTVADMCHCTHAGTFLVCVSAVHPAVVMSSTGRAVGVGVFW